MKTNHIKYFLMAILLLLSGCAPQFPTLENAYISPLDIGISDTLHFLNLALSPNGQMVTDVNLKQFDLETGIESKPYQNYTDSNDFLKWINDVGGWSPDGRYLGVAGIVYDKITDTTQNQVRIIDTQAHTIQEAAGDVLWEWSPFNTGSYMSRRQDATKDDVLSVYNLHNQNSPIPLDSTYQYDFTKENQVGGNGLHLWSKKLDIPIAELAPLWSGTAENMTWRSLAIISFFDHAIPSERKYRLTLLDDPSAHIVGAIFDPTGEYVLVAQWDCVYTDMQHCSDINIPTITEGITDSVFTLIRWRTGESHELFRLSTVDAQNIIASGDLYWSADGSTILVGRIQAPFVVLKVK